MSTRYAWVSKKAHGSYLVMHGIDGHDYFGIWQRELLNQSRPSR